MVTSTLTTCREDRLNSVTSQEGVSAVGRVTFQASTGQVRSMRIDIQRTSFHQGDQWGQSTKSISSASSITAKDISSVTRRPSARGKA